MQPAGGGSATSAAAKVIPFQRGAPATSKQVGQIPADFSQWSGTIVSGTAANNATEAALAAYPGAIVDRVLLPSNGDYNVHYIGVNWPHHVSSTRTSRSSAPNSQHGRADISPDGSSGPLRAACRQAAGIRQVPLAGVTEFDLR